MAEQKVKTRGKVSNCTHHWTISSVNVGHCKYCGEVRDFGEILVREGQYVRKSGQRGAKARKEGLRKRKGRPPKYE